MELYKEMIIKVFEENKFELETMIEKECYSMLTKIRDIIRYDKLDDVECFKRIEEIVCIYEQYGSNGGNRHDF